MNHPLTDDIIESELATPAHFTSGSLVGLFTHDDLRAAADWQLEQCVEELERLLSIFGVTGVIKEEAVPTMVELFKANMRPQEDNQ